MPRRFLALNLALAAAATLLIVYIVRQFVAPMPLPVGGRRAPAGHVDGDRHGEDAGQRL